MKIRTAEKKETRNLSHEKAGYVSKPAACPVFPFFNNIRSCTCDGGCPRCAPVQAKLNISAPQDPCEQEAEQVAGEIMHTSNQPRERISGVKTKANPIPVAAKIKNAGSERLSKSGQMKKGNPSKADENEEQVDEDGLIQTKHLAGGEVPSNLAQHSQHTLDRGTPMPESARLFFEPRFGRDFTEVRFHTGAKSDKASRALKAQAFTRGSDIYFNHAYYSPETFAGKKLIAHELTHVLQQGTTGYDHDYPFSSKIMRSPDDSETGADSELPDLTNVIWEQDSDHLVAVYSGNKLMISEQIYRPLALENSAQECSWEEVYTPGETKSYSDPWYGVPAVGKEGRMLVRTGQGVGIWLDAGGAPAALLPETLLALKAEMGVETIEEIVILHVHSDHVRDLIKEIKRSKVAAEKLIISDAWLQGTTGPLAKLVQELKTTVDPELTALGYGAKWIPASPQVSGLPTVGIIRIPIKIGEIEMELIGTGEAFKAYSAAHKQGEVQSATGDTASFLTLLKNPKADFQIAVVGDLRGSDILKIKEEMGEKKFNEIFSNVRVFAGLQHHLGAINSPKDIEGIMAMLEPALEKQGGLTVIVQSSQEFYNKELVTLLQKLGVRVIIAEGNSEENPGSIMVSTTGQVKIKGEVIEDFKGQDTSQKANLRLAKLIGLYEGIKANGELLEYPGSTKEKVLEELLLQIERLRALRKEKAELFTNPLLEKPKTGLRTEQDIATDQNKVQGIEAQITEKEFEMVKKISANPAAYSKLQEEVKSMRTTGQASPKLYELIVQLEPEVAKALLFNAKGEPLPLEQVMAQAKKQVQLQQMLLSGSTKPVGIGGKVVCWTLIGIEIMNQTAPLVAAARQANLQDDILDFLDSIRWWVERGVVPKLGGAINPVFSEATILTDQTDIWNRVQKKIWENIPSDVRIEESKLPQEIKESEGLDYLWIEEIPEESWDTFTLWVTAHIRDFNEYADSFIDTHTQAVQRVGTSFETFEWKVQLGEFDTSYINSLEKEYVKSERLTTIMQKTAQRVIAGTEAEIQKSWETHTDPEPPGPTISAMPSADVGIQPHAAIESLQPTRRAHFTEDADQKLYSDYMPSQPIMGKADWFKVSPPYFLTFENADAPEGYVLVSGADYNTYAAIRSVETYQYDPLKVVKIPKKILKLYEPFPTDDNRTPEQKAALKQAGLGDIKYKKYNTSSSDPYEGEVQYWFYGPNKMALGYAEKSELIFEEE